MNDNDELGLTVWNYSKSGRIPHYILLEMAKNDDLSFEAIGVFITLFLTKELKPVPCRTRNEPTLMISVNELLKHNLLVSKEIQEMAEKMRMPIEEDSCE